MEPSTDFESTIIKQDMSCCSNVLPKDNIDNNNYLENPCDMLNVNYADVTESAMTEDLREKEEDVFKIENTIHTNENKAVHSSDSSNLTMFKKPVIIFNEFENKLLRYEPKRFSFKEKYSIKETVYECSLAPTKVYIGEDKKTGEPVAIKETNKIKLGHDIYSELVINELAVSKYLSRITHSVVHVYDYFEEDDSYVIVMELCDRPNFFEELLENVSILFLILIEICFNRK